MYVHYVSGFNMRSGTADNVFQVKDAHSLITVQVYAAFARAEPKAFLFGAEALAELIGIYANFPFLGSSNPISSCHTLQVLKF